MHLWVVVKRRVCHHTRIEKGGEERALVKLLAALACVGCEVGVRVAIGAARRGIAVMLSTRPTLRCGGGIES